MAALQPLDGRQLLPALLDRVLQLARASFTVDRPWYQGEYGTLLMCVALFHPQYAPWASRVSPWQHTNAQGVTAIDLLAQWGPEEQTDWLAPESTAALYNSVVSEPLFLPISQYFVRLLGSALSQKAAVENFYHQCLLPLKRRAGNGLFLAPWQIQGAVKSVVQALVLPATGERPDRSQEHSEGEAAPPPVFAPVATGQNASVLPRCLELLMQDVGLDQKHPAVTYQTFLKAEEEEMKVDVICSEANHDPRLIAETLRKQILVRFALLLRWTVVGGSSCWSCFSCVWCGRLWKVNYYRRSNNQRCQ